MTGTLIHHNEVGADNFQDNRVHSSGDSLIGIPIKFYPQSLERHVYENQFTLYDWDSPGRRGCGNYVPQVHV